MKYLNLSDFDSLGKINEVLKKYTLKRFEISPLHSLRQWPKVNHSDQFHKFKRSKPRVNIASSTYQPSGAFVTRANYFPL